MSLPLTDDNGVVQTIANGTPVSWSAGLGYDANGLLCVTSTISATDTWQNGWRRDIQGRLVVSQSTPEGQPFVYSAGWPTDKNTGAIITQQNIPAPTDPRIAGVAVGPLGGVYMTECGYIWTPLALWPTGTEPGMWIDPSNLASQWQDSTGTTPVATPGTVADSSNPVGLALDLRLGATALTDPGNHLLQATSTARPLLSARRNLLTYTEDFSNAAWAGKQNLTVVSDAIAPPTGFANADKLVGTATDATHRLLQISVTGKNTCSFVVHSAELRRCALIIGAPFAGAWFDTTSGTCGALTDYPDTVTQSIESVGGGFYRCSVTVDGITGQEQGVQFALLPDGATSYAETSVALDGSGLYVTGAQLNRGPATPYQPILTDGSTYTSTGITPFQLYDGTDDGMATATFAAGTLIDGMDCMIAVRRDASIVGIAGLSNGVVNNSFFGFYHDIGTEPNYGDCGTPTTWLDGVQLAGGTGTTRATLYSALTAGEWHILEFRNLDLSTWVGSAFSVFMNAYRLNGARGDIMLYPSTASTEDKDAARQYLADKYGVTLPAWVGRYNYVTPPTSSIPVAGEIVHGDNLLNKLNFSKTDLDGQTYTGPLLTTGHAVKIGDQVYTLVAPPVDFSSYITLTIEPATQLADGTYPVLVY